MKTAPSSNGVLVIACCSYANSYERAFALHRFYFRELDWFSNACIQYVVVTLTLRLVRNLATNMNSEVFLGRAL